MYTYIHTYIHIYIYIIYIYTHQILNALCKVKLKIEKTLSF